MTIALRDLSSIPNLKEVLLESFTPSSEEVKSAASYALGSVAVGNLPEFLPFILTEIEAQPKRQYLLLHSLREVPFLFIILFTQRNRINIKFINFLVCD